MKNHLEKYWETVVSNIKDGVMIVDTAGYIVSVNDAMENITGYTHSELVGQKCSILNCSLFNLARGQGGQHWCVLLRTGNLDLRRCTIMRKDGSFVQVLKNASRLEDDQGTVIGGVETITDITEIVQKDQKVIEFHRQLQPEGSFQGIIGTSPTMQQVFKVIAGCSPFRRSGPQFRRERNRQGTGWDPRKPSTGE